jgi:hypothetical protein
MVAGHVSRLGHLDIERGKSLAHDLETAVSRDAAPTSANNMGSAGTENTKNIHATSPIAHKSGCENLYDVSKGSVMSLGYSTLIVV